MLFRHTMLYLPAQLLPALCQFAQLIVWSHLAAPAVIGVVTLFTSVQEFLNIGFMGFWTQYTIRYAVKYAETEDGRARMRLTASVIVALSLAIQIGIGLAIYAVMIERSMTLVTGLTLAGLIGFRALNLYQGERARAAGDVFGYSVAVMSGPVLGFLVGLALMWRYGGNAFVVFLGFTVAQLLGVLVGLSRDTAWIGIGRPDWRLIRHAIGYGGPLIVGNVLAWVTQNASRVVVGYMLGLSAAGFYSLGMGLGYRAAVVAAMMVTAAAFPIAVRMANAGDLAGAQRQLAVNGALLLAVLAASLFGFALVSHDVLHLLVARKMSGPVAPIMLWSMLAGAFICIRTHFFNQIFLLQSLTRPIATVAIVEAVVAVVLAVLVVRVAGPLGGAIALAATSGLSMAATYVLARRAGLIIPWEAIGRIGLASLAMTSIVLMIPPAPNVLRLIGRILAGGAAYSLVLMLLYRSELIGMRRSRRTRPGG